jgi:hypothetical protein
LTWWIKNWFPLASSELASLTPESFDLDADKPAVTVEAAYSKRRRRDSQLLRPDLAVLLRDYLGTKAPGQPVGPGDLKAASESWWLHAAVMVKADLEVAMMKLAGFSTFAL